MIDHPVDIIIFICNTYKPKDKNYDNAIVCTLICLQKKTIHIHIQRSVSTNPRTD